MSFLGFMPLMSTPPHCYFLKDNVIFLPFLQNDTEKMDSLMLIKTKVKSFMSTFRFVKVMSEV